MADRLTLMACENHRNVIEHIVRSGVLPDVSLRFFTPRCASSGPDWDSISEQIAASHLDPENTILFCGSCVAGSDALPHDLAGCRIIGGEHCTSWYIDEQALGELRGDGAYIVTSGWLRRWPDQMREWGFERDAAIEFFHESASKLVLLDDGLDPEAAVRLAALSDYLDLPAETVMSGLDHLRAVLVQSVFGWRLERLRSASSEAIDRANLLAANHASVADLVTRIASASSEAEIIDQTFDTLTMLFAPGRVSYLPVVDGVAGTLRYLPTTMPEPEGLARRLADVPDEYRWAPDGSGLTLRVEHMSQTLGVLEAAEFAHPERREDYLGLALGIARACGLALAQARSVQALQRSEEKFRTIISSMSDMIFLLDGEDVFLDAYCGPESPLYAAPEKFIEKRHREVMPPEVCEHWDRHSARLRATGESQRYEYPLQIDSREMWFTATLDLHADGESVVATVRDITARKRAEAERQALDAKVQQAQKLESLGVLAGGIAHDFNNLLVGILGGAELVLMDLPPESPIKGSIQDISVAARRAADLAKQMLAYSGKGKFVIQSLHLGNLIEEITHLLKTSISKKSVVKFDFADNLPRIEADATQLRQIIMNLVINASEAIGDRSGVISIRTGVLDCDRDYLDEVYLDSELPEGLYAYFEVADTGCGMDAETLACIYDPFFTTKFTGRGLGLAAVLGIVRGHQGGIRVYSEPGQGTTFRVLFPAVPGSTASGDSAANGKAFGSLKGKTVLLVDDDETVRSVGRQILERFGMVVDAAVDGREALRLFEADPDRFDCVLLDLTMPHIDGEEAFREMRRIDPGARIVLSSGYNEQDLTQRFAGKRLSGFILKPYSPEALREIMLTVLDADPEA